MASEAQRKAVIAYNRRQDNIMIRPSKEEGARIRKAAAEAGKSVQAYILDILRSSEPVREAHWIKRMEEKTIHGARVFDPIWSCSECGNDYDPAVCSIVKYCFNCGAKIQEGFVND